MQCFACMSCICALVIFGVSANLICTVIPRENVYLLDGKWRVSKRAPFDVFKSNIEYKLADVVYSRYVSLDDDEKDNLRNHILDVGAGAAAFFVQRLTWTNLKYCMKFSKAITDDLGTDNKGDILIYARKPEVACELQFRVDLDGRMTIVGSKSWGGFCGDNFAQEK